MLIMLSTEKYALLGYTSLLHVWNRCTKAWQNDRWNYYFRSLVKPSFSLRIYAYTNLRSYECTYESTLIRMYVRIYAYTNVRTNLRLYECTYESTLTRVLVRIYAYSILIQMYVRIYAYTSALTNLRLYKCTYESTLIRMYVRIYAYTLTINDWQLTIPLLEARLLPKYAHCQPQIINRQSSILIRY